MKLIKLSMLTLTLTNLLISPSAVIAQENNTVDILTSVTGGKDEEDAKAFNQKLEELTGLKVNIEKPAEDYNTVVLQKLSNGGEGLDLIYFNQDQLNDLVEQGALLDITDYVKNSEILSDPEVISQSEWDNITIDGKLYAGFNKKEIHRVVNLNQALLKKYKIEGLSEETLDGYYKLFKEMKDKVTDIDNFYPYNAVISNLFDLQPWFASQDIKTGIVINEAGKRTAPIASQEAKPVWEWLRKLYQEELMDPSSLTDTTKELREKFGANQTGVVVDWAAWTGLYNSNDGADYPDKFEAVPLGGTNNSDGKYMLTRGGASLWGIPATSDNVEGAIKVLETFATQEGGILLSLGAEGYDYVIEDGKYKLTEVGESHGKDHGAPFPISEKFEAPLPHNPGVDDAMKLLTFASTESFLPESAKYNEIVAQKAVEIIRGDVDVDTGLKEMQQALLDAGVIEE